jgi:hypothetical protein
MLSSIDRSAAPKLLVRRGPTRRESARAGGLLFGSAVVLLAAASMPKVLQDGLWRPPVSRQHNSKAPPYVARVPRGLYEVTYTDGTGSLPQSREPRDLRLFLGVEPDASGQRSADEAMAARLPPQRIPRRILQIGLLGVNWTASIAQYGKYMRSWWSLNPEYRYEFWTDRMANEWVERRCTREERRAYRSLLLGAQKSDVLRMLICKYEGCIYADLDLELLRPLREVIPPNASAVAADWGIGARSPAERRFGASRLCWHCARSEPRASLLR